MSAVLWALVAVPLVTGTGLLAAGRRADRTAAPVAVLAALVATGLAVAAALRPTFAVEAPFLLGLPLRLAVDGLSGLLAVTVTAVTLAVLLFSAAELGAEEARARFFGLMLLFAGSMLVTVTAATLPVLLMGWEVMGATSWALIGFWWRDPARTEAADTAFITTRTGDLGLYVAAGAAVAAGHDRGLSLDALQHAGSPWLAVITIGLIAAAFGKSAQLPFSFWLSGAMQGPSPVSALLHSATMVVAGAYLLLRTGPVLAASGWGADVVAWTGAVTAIALGLVAVAQTALKQLLAASSCAQIGLMVLAAGVLAELGGTLQLIAHAAAKSLLFLCAGVWLTALGTQHLPELGGAARVRRSVGVTFTVGALCLAGLPPLALWAAKDVLLAGALGRSPWLYAAGLAAAVLSAVYSAKALWYVWRPTPSHAARIPGGTVPALVVLAVACLALAPLAFPPLVDSIAETLGIQNAPAPYAWELALSAGLAILGVAGTWIWAGRPAPLTGWAKAALCDWLHLRRAAYVLLVNPVMRLARLAAAVDDRVIDRAAEGAARGTLRLAYGTDRIAERAMDGAVGAVAAGTRLLGRWARLPQTGQVHQYLAQAVAVLTVMAVALVLMR